MVLFISNAHFGDLFSFAIGEFALATVTFASLECEVIGYPWKMEWNRGCGPKNVWIRHGSGAEEWVDLGGFKWRYFML